MANKRISSKKRISSPKKTEIPLDSGDSTDHVELQRYARNKKADEQESRIQQAKQEYKESAIPQRLREIREMEYITQSSLAKVLSISQPYYSAFEDGTRMLTAPMLMVLAKEGFSVDYILAGRGSRTYCEPSGNSTDLEVMKKENELLKKENDFLKRQVESLTELLKNK